MFKVVLIEPEIPPNTGNVGRLCLATCSTLHLVKPLGFSLDDRQLKRAGLDYWGDVDLKTWDSFAELQGAQAADTRYFFLTTKTKRAYCDVKFQPGDFLVFGRETKGLPLFDNCDLERLAEAAASRKRWSFLLTAAPLPIRGGTGSPLNPIATF